MQILKTPAAKARTKRVKSVLKLLGLSRRHVILARRGTAWQPYHNYQHCYEVALATYHGAIWERLGRQDTKQVFLAALYHDHRHTADYRVPDKENIRRAIKGARWKLFLHRWGLRGYDRRTIPYLIDATQEGRRGKTPAARILRDAETLANLNDEAAVWFEALSKESGLEYTIQSALTYLTEDKVLTEWGMSKLVAFRRRYGYQDPFNFDIPVSGHQPVTEVKSAPNNADYRYTSH